MLSEVTGQFPLLTAREILLWGTVFYFILWSNIEHDLKRIQFCVPIGTILPILSLPFNHGNPSSVLWQITSVAGS